MAPLNIMYVEDNTDVRHLVQELIESDDRRIVACADAEAAWACLTRESFDVLITDVNLPGCSGTELARRWLEDDSTRRVILLSGYAFQSDLTGLGSHVSAIPKEDFEQLDQALAAISAQLQDRSPGTQ